LGRILSLAIAGAVNVAGIVVVLAYVAGNGRLRLGPGSVAGRIGDVLMFALLCGVLAFATIEILKRVLALRGYYQRFKTREWLGDRTKHGDGALRELMSCMGLGTLDRRGQSLFELTEAQRVFNLPTEQLAAQISAAADVAVATHRLGLLSGLTRLPPDAILERINASTRGDRHPGYDPGFELSQQIRAGIDQLQISLSERWRRLLQGAALWISGLYGIALAGSLPEASGQATVQPTSRSLYVFSALVIGGLVAWTIRDLTAAIARSRS
jgi:hypothetical protein